MRKALATPTPRQRPIEGLKNPTPRPYLNPPSTSSCVRHAGGEAQVKNEGTLPAMLTWGMQDANVDAKEAAKKVDVFIKVRGCLVAGSPSDSESKPSCSNERECKPSVYSAPSVCAHTYECGAVSVANQATDRRRVKTTHDCKLKTNRPQKSPVVSIGRGF